MKEFFYFKKNIFNIIILKYTKTLKIKLISSKKIKIKKKIIKCGSYIKNKQTAAAFKSPCENVLDLKSDERWR